MTDSYTLRPGLLVSMSTSLRGNTHYRTLELESDHLDDEGRRVARWETERIVADPDEHERAIKVRTEARGLIIKCCNNTAFGLLCPNTREADLRNAITSARELCEAFNATAKLTRLNFNVIYGRIAQDDVEAVRAISSEIRSLMEDMQDGVKSMNVKAIRDAASQAVQVGNMLSPEAKGRLDVAIEAARKAARKIAKVGEQAAVEIDRDTLSRIDMARTSFLDIDLASTLQEPVMSGRAIDIEESSWADAARDLGGGLPVN